jgi:hypothetical protein
LPLPCRSFNSLSESNAKISLRVILHTAVSRFKLTRFELS